jgi:hypothetical protein
MKIRSAHRISVLGWLAACHVCLVAQTNFAYKLAQAAHTSAGVFDARGVLIRTLWSNKTQLRGRYSETWDGKDDNGRDASGQAYQIRVLEDNVVYSWEGPIGNTEKSWTSVDGWSYFGDQPGLHLLFVGDVGWIVGGYSEGQYNFGFIKASDPNTPHVFNTNYLNQKVCFTDGATDGHRLYLMNSAGAFANVNYTTVFDAHTGLPASFTEGTTVSGMPDAFIHMTLSVIDHGKSYVDSPTGIAVQRDGSILAIAHGNYRNSRLVPTHGSDSVRLFDKNSGSPVGTNISIPNPQSMAFSSAGLWVVSNGSLLLVTDVGRDDLVTKPITGLSNVVAVAVNSLTNHVFLLDGGASQQMKEFDAAYRLVRTYGDKGGYTDKNPAITNSRLNLDDTAVYGRSTANGSWITVTDSNDVWFNDAGTAHRLLHVSPSNTYVDQVMYSGSYNVAVDHENPKRVFRDMFEYAIDYSVPNLPGDPALSPGGHRSWTLVRNWAIAGVLPSLITERTNIITTEDLTNHRTYATVTGVDGWCYEVELPSSGTQPLRYTGSSNRFNTNRLERDGSLMRISESGPDEAVTVRIQQSNLTGFDQSQNPVRSPFADVAVVTVNRKYQNTEHTGWGTRTQPYPSAAGVYPVYKGNSQKQAGYPHLSGAKAGQSSYLFSVNREVITQQRDLQGGFPSKDGYGAHSGIAAVAEGHHIVAGYDGQYAPWGNVFSDYWDDGLLVGAFTQTSPAVSRFPGVPVPPIPSGFAANIANLMLVTLGSDLYMYIPTESGFGPIDRWHISGLKSIHELGANGKNNRKVTLKRLF